MDRRIESVALAIPAYNEEGIVGFLRDIDAALTAADRKVSIHIVDDRSTTDMAERVREAAGELAASVEVTVNEANMGHGPTAVRAYRSAVASGADAVLQVDGDGQFDAADLNRLVEELERGADVAEGVRQGRVDPWFRKMLSALLRLHVLVLFGARSKDPNCPFRGYTRDSLESLLGGLPPDPLVPTVYLTALARRRGLKITTIVVQHRVRRGDQAQGRMWGAGNRKILIPRRLLKFVGRAFTESVLFAIEVRRG